MHASSFYTYYFWSYQDQILSVPTAREIWEPLLLSLSELPFHLGEINCPNRALVDRRETGWAGYASFTQAGFCSPDGHSTTYYQAPRCPRSK